MKTSDALKYYSNSPLLLGRALGISSQAVSQWGEYVPFKRAWQLEKITNGELTIEDEFEAKQDSNQVA